MRSAETTGSMAMLKRWGIFNIVGLLGIGVQIALLSLLREWAGLHHLTATALAVEGAVLHNFWWHQRWTWHDRGRCRQSVRLVRLVRFNLSTGAVSIISNLFLMLLLVDGMGLHYLPANLLAITVCSVANFLLSDRFVFRAAGPMKRALLPCAAMCLLCLVVPASGAELQGETVDAWQRYVRLTEGRIERELHSSRGFLAIDFLQEENGEAGRDAVLRGEIPVTRMQTRHSDGSEIDVPGGMIHHWLGAVFIPDAKLDEIVTRLRAAKPRDHQQEDVLESRVLVRDGDSLRVYLKLIRSKIVTVVYNTEHEVRYRHYGNLRASSSSQAVRIAELENAGTPAESEKPVGNDRGYLWRLNSYWRYEQVGNGVVVECESLSLSRSIPLGLEFLVRPIINKVARESMHRTLATQRGAGSGT